MNSPLFQLISWAVHRRLFVMPTGPASKIAVSEWRTVLAAGRHYRENLAATASGIQDEDQQLVAFEDIERLDRIIRSLDYQIGSTSRLTWHQAKRFKDLHRKQQSAWEDVPDGWLSICEERRCSEKS